MSTSDPYKSSSNKEEVTLPCVLSEMLKNGYVTTRKGDKLPLHSHLPEHEGLLLQSWLKSYKPINLLEIGLAYGVSSLYICKAVSNWKINQYHIIDAFQMSEWSGLGAHHLHEAGYGELFCLHEMRSELCLPKFLYEGKRFDFAFIDGWHTFDQALVEFYYINRMLDIGGILIFDDLHLPSLQKLRAYIDGYDCYERLPVPPEFQTSMVWRLRQMMKVPVSRIDGFIKTNNDNRSWEWFKDF